jgi:DNA polymerase
MEQISRQRLKWWLRAERALGLSHVPAAKADLLADYPQTAPQTDEHVSVQATEIRRAAPPAPMSPAAMPSRNVAAPVVRAPEIAQPSLITPAALAPFVAEMPEAEKPVALRLLDESQVRGCTKCQLCRTRRNTVFGEGDPNARLMFVGEGPGMQEDASGRPFVGRAGQKLDEMIKAMGFSREQVYICNVVKCRAYLAGPPPKDRPPQPEEAAACMPYLHRQIEVVRPRAIVTLGLSAMQYLLGVKQSMSRMRGNWQSWQGIPVMPTFHPSYILRNPTVETRRAVWDDLKQVMAKLKGVP